MLRSIRIEAEGYEPAEFLGFLDNVEDIAHDFKLRKAAPLTGIVRGPDGQPLAGVDVALSGADYDARIENGRLMANRAVGEAPHTKTGPDGRYRVPAAGEAASRSSPSTTPGSRSVRPTELAASTDITLAPWGRIEGVMKIGTKPAPGQKVAAWLLRPGIPRPGRLRHPDRRVRPVRLRAGHARAGWTSIATSRTRTTGAGRPPTR